MSVTCPNYLAPKYYSAMIRDFIQRKGNFSQLNMSRRNCDMIWNIISQIKNKVKVKIFI